VSRENLDRRLLGAVRFVDAVTGAEILSTLRVDAPGVRWVRNLRGWFVAAQAPGLEAHTLPLDAPPAEPEPGAVPVTLRVTDPAGRYLPRMALLTLPRDPDPANKDAAGSLFLPESVELYPSPVMRAAPGWAVIRVAAADAQGRPAAGALFRVLRKSGGGLLGRGMADARGEALVAVPGIPVTTWDDEGQGGVLATEVEARLEVHYTPAAAIEGDVASLEALEPITTRELKLSSGGTITLSLVV
jgi:hypothetical protein